MTDVTDIEGLADLLTAAMPRLDATEQQIALAVLRQLARDIPVSVSRIAGAVDLPEVEVADTLNRLPGLFRDDEQRVVGFMGLTVVEMGHHRIHFDGRALSAWCAWDTLFLPELLGQTARVTSRCPTSGEEISLIVTPTGPPTDLRPAEAVVSFLLPETEFDADVIRSFCHFVHFFASPEAGAKWTAEHPGTFLISVDDAHRLGQLTNRAAFAAVMPAGGQR